MRLKKTTTVNLINTASHKLASNIGSPLQKKVIIGLANMDLISIYTYLIGLLLSKISSFIYIV